ncbi:MAG: hypothetical protein ABIF11_01770 [Nitrospirota bacterium]
MKIYKIQFKALSPLHIGYGRKIGIINQTRYYIMGKNMWGALTAQLARRIMNNYSKEIYEEAGKFVRENLIFTNFYPVINNQVCLPQFRPKGIFYGDYSEGQDAYSKYEFESLILDSYTSTALQMKSAEEGSLHEIEFLKNRVNGQDVLFEGYLLAKGEISSDGQNIVYAGEPHSISEVLKNIEVGGERKYGFGRLELNNGIGNGSDTSLWGFSIENEQINIPAESCSPFHVRIENPFRFIGDIEPLVGKEWENEKGADKAGTGQKVLHHAVCLIPGSQIKENIKLKIECYGIGGGSPPLAGGRGKMALTD